MFVTLEPIMDKKRVFLKICNDIKSVKIQGARNVAKKALYAYSLIPTKKSKKTLLSLRPTEPMLSNALKKIDKEPYENIIKHFDEAQSKINGAILKIIRQNEVIFTHCHSTNVINALIFSKKKGKKFQVYNTETRPLFQGRKTSRELAKAGIRVTQFVDSALANAIERENKKDKIYATKIFLGADALIKEGIINKVGSKAISELASFHKIPIYIIADSWKFTNKRVPIEQRPLNEVWDKAPKNIKIKNPAFEFVPKKYITKIVSELGVLRYDDFIKNVKMTKNEPN
jgi:translation initiation factor 2B subunit (eIF-2B alpha/beta/delta family)